ncbi:MAG: SUMF1/EgtB/PvdO family nonheme iron enzyme, partial [Treponema sp.]|nr:SUMF1/EgtB/PvdO family nonheme iron enzyme [Treponema sp.]
TDPVGPASGSYRVNRGGSWNYAEQFLRSAHRYYFAPNARGGNVGFRVARR